MVWHAVNRNDLSPESCAQWAGFHVAHTSIDRHRRHRLACADSSLHAWIYTYPAALFESVRLPTGALQPGNSRPWVHYGNPFEYLPAYRENLLPWVRNRAGQPVVDFPSTGHRFWPDYNRVDILEQVGRLQQRLQEHYRMTPIDDEELQRILHGFGAAATTPAQKSVDYNRDRRIDDSDLLYALMHFGEIAQCDPPHTYQTIEGWFVDNAPEFFHNYHQYLTPDRAYAIGAYDRFRTVLKAVVPHALIAANVYEGGFLTIQRGVNGDATLTGWGREWILQCVDAVFFENWMSHWASSGGFLPESTQESIRLRVDACVKLGKLVVLGVPHAVSDADAQTKRLAIQDAITRWGESVRFAEYRTTLYTGREPGYPRPMRELL